MTPREAFCAVLANGPLRSGDAIVVLSGDGKTRVDVAFELLMQHAAKQVVVTGGLDNPPHSLTADQMRSYLIELGLRPDLIITEPTAMNTHEQAEAVVDLAVEREWKHLLLIASPYHQYRAFLTFLQVLNDRDLDKTIRLQSIPATQTRWWAKPDGLDETRFDMLEGEFDKIAAYRRKGHVATYETGLSYLEYWESR